MGRLDPAAGDRMRSRLTTSLAAAVMALTLVTAVPAAAHGPGHPGPGHHAPGHPGHGPGHHHRPTTYLLDPVGPAADDVYPEGVATHGDHFYVSSTTDGTIYRGSHLFDATLPLLAHLHDWGIGRTFLTNNTSRS